MKKTLVLGATTDPTRYAFLATQRLTSHGHPVVLLGNKRGSVFGEEIQHGRPDLKDIDTVTLYMNPRNQEEYLDYLIGLKPKRIIFNPGTENDKLIEMAEQNGIEPVIGCTLVMLSTNQF
jgi:uncharacterized protein